MILQSIPHVSHILISLLEYVLELFYIYYTLCFYHVTSVSASCSSEGFIMIFLCLSCVLFVFPLCFTHRHHMLQS